jgi:hypothetical protein
VVLHCSLVSDHLFIAFIESILIEYIQNVAGARKNKIISYYVHSDVTSVYLQVKVHLEIPPLSQKLQCEIATNILD